MSDEPTREQADAETSSALRPEELLPPVDEPSAGFILQLFVLPALIVIVIVAVWVMFNWLVHRTSTRPEDLIQGLQQGPSVARWQKASELADMLRNDRFKEFRRDAKSAAQLARILNREIDGAENADGMSEENVTLRYYMARALGTFEVNEGIDVLLKAATTARDPKEQFVRHGALEAIAMRAYNLQQLKPPSQLEHPELISTLVKLSSDDDALVRKRVAYALGQIGTPAALEQLRVMVDDPHGDTRYNAALALAHHGDLLAIATLAEMLGLEEPASVEEETNEQDRALKRAVIFTNALAAVEKLRASHPEGDFAPIVESLETLSQASDEALAQARIPKRLAAEGKRVLESLQKSP